jgi:hypothetical protein
VFVAQDAMPDRGVLPGDRLVYFPACDDRPAEVRLSRPSPIDAVELVSLLATGMVTPKDDARPPSREAAPDLRLLR